MSSPAHDEVLDERYISVSGLSGSDTDSEHGSEYSDDAPAVKVGDIFTSMVDTACRFFSSVPQEPGHSLTSAQWAHGCKELHGGVTSLFNAYSTGLLEPDREYLAHTKESIRDLSTALAPGGTNSLTDAEQTKYTPYGRAAAGLLDLIKVLADATVDSMGDPITPIADLPIEYGNKLKAVLMTLGTVEAAASEHKNRIKALADEGVVTQDQMLQGTLLLKEVLQDLERKTSV